jgi:hypothetical protein
MTLKTERKPLVVLVKADFDYLFNDLGFTIAFTRENPQRDYSEVVLESAHCFIKFSWQRGEWEMQIASRTVPVAQAEWMSIGLVYNYVTQAPVDMEEALKPRPIVPPEVTLIQWAEKLRPVAAEVVAFFNPDGYAQHLRQFHQFVSEQNAEAKRQLQALEAKKRVA